MRIELMDIAIEREKIDRTARPHFVDRHAQEDGRASLVAARRDAAHRSAGSHVFVARLVRRQAKQQAQVICSSSPAPS